MNDDSQGLPPGTLFLKRTQVTVTWPDGRQENIPLAKNVVRIGRGMENNEVAVQENFDSISRKHLEIRREGSAYTVHDLGSSNGTYLNGLKVENAPLQDGDEICIGSADDKEEVRIKFQLGTEILLGTAVTKRGSTSSLPKLSSLPPVANPYLAIRWPDGQTNYFPIEKNTVLIGRTVDADLTIPDELRFVSSRHLELRRDGASFTITDLNSTNGTLINNKPLAPNMPVPLYNETIIRIGDESLGISLGLTFINPFEPSAPIEGLSMIAPKIFVPPARELMIGRSSTCDIHLDSPNVSRRHASLREENKHYFLEDLGSANGTRVNDRPIKRVELQDGDLITVGDFLLVFQNGQITPYQSNGMRLDVEGLYKDVKGRRGKLRILDNINMSILPREFVGLVGGSGAGKSTLLNALVGIRPGKGKVNLNGHDFYKEFDQFRSQLGYVPQNDILHTTLTVDRALDYAARLRMPATITPEERKRRIAAVLDTVSMNDPIIRKTRVGDLSGGQRKRVSIAAELLADPKLIYLDEATSGLDPGLEKKLMHTLRRMADEGRTVVLITHATNNIVQTDHVAFLSQGRLIFFGPSQDALDFFEVKDFADIYEKIETNAEELQQVYQNTKPDNYKKYVVGRLATSRLEPKRELSKVRFGLNDLLRQFIVLTQRSLAVLFSDPITLGLMLLLLPLTGLLQLVIGSKDILTGNLSILADPLSAAKTLLANYTPYPHTNTFVFVMGLEAVLTGLFVPSNDLVKERSIYLRERMVNLKVLPYLMSKAAIYSVFVLIQVTLYLVILGLKVDFPNQGLYFPGVIEIFITLFLTMMAGISFGLIISAVSRSTEMAIYLLTMMLFFQFFFAGAVFDLRGNSFEPLSYLSTTRWSLTALGVTINMPKIAEGTILCSTVPKNPLDPTSGTQTLCTNYTDARKDLMLNYDNGQLPEAWGVLIGMSIIFLTVTGLLLTRTRSN
jgi:ABC transport system ATP-binding/permease protein